MHLEIAGMHLEMAGSKEGLGQHCWKRLWMKQLCYAGKACGRRRKEKKRQRGESRGN
jgi:hypothetical protein